MANEVSIFHKFKDHFYIFFHHLFMFLSMFLSGFHGFPLSHLKSSSYINDVSL